MHVRNLRLDFFIFFLVFPPSYLVSTGLHGLQSHASCKRFIFIAVLLVCLCLDKSLDPLWLASFTGNYRQRTMKRLVWSAASRAGGRGLEGFIK